MNIGFLKVVQLILSVVVILLVLVQTKSQGLTAGVASAFTMYRSRRGFEKMVFVATIVTSVLLIVNSILLLVLH